MGEGTCILEGKVLVYSPGVIGTIPADKIHRVDAGKDGLLLLATFSPPLV
jgi:quercetin dioxygenase-like cupin family protein